MWYPDSGAMKEVFVNYDSEENRRDLLEPRNNIAVSSFYEEIVNIMGGINV